MHHRSIVAALGFALGAAAHAQAPLDSPPSPAGPPLSDAMGVPFGSGPGGTPGRPMHRTRAGLYATEAQARQLEARLHDQVIVQRVACCGTMGIDEAVRRVWHAHLAYDTPTSIAVLVYGDDLWHAAQVVDRLTDMGLERVFLVSVP